MLSEHFKFFQALKARENDVEQKFQCDFRFAPLCDQFAKLKQIKRILCATCGSNSKQGKQTKQFVNSSTKNVTKDQ